MFPPFPNQLPVDEVVLCDSNNDCIEARGENAKLLIQAVTFALVLYGLSQVVKALK